MYLIPEPRSWTPIVLAVVSHDAEGTYGYKITQDVRQAIEISESHAVPGAQKAAERRLP